jgi:predicted nucleic acid-binding protein
MKTHAKSDGLLPMDALIAATALNEGITLSTKNKKTFREHRRARPGSAEVLKSAAASATVESRAGIEKLEC